MDKIKNILHPHKDREAAGAGDVAHNTNRTAAQSTTGTAGATTSTGATPIYDQMTGEKSPTTSNVGAGTGTSTSTGLAGAGTSTSTGLAGDRHAGTDSSIGGARVGGSSGNNHLTDSARTASDRPQASSGAYDGNSEASIKSGVIGFTPGQAGQGHAALPSNIPVADKLDRNQVVGQGSADTSSGLRNEVTNEQPSVLPVSSNTHSSSTHQPHDTDRSFPLSGGVTSGHDHSSSTTGTHSAHGLKTNERELGTKERELAGGDRHGREALAGAAAAAAGTAAATQSHHSTAREPQVGDRIASPTGHTHLTSSVKEHNIHPDALHAAGARPVNDSTEPGHGPPYETPHINTGTLLDYEKAYGSDPHTKHTGLLDYRPHAHRSDTSPHIPGEFPEVTPDTERAGPILGAGATSGSTTGPSASHDLRHTGSLTDPATRSTDTSSHHLGRDAAIAGGVGAAGLGAAAHHQHASSATGTGNLYDEKNPYNSKALDPRVTGGESRLEDQRFDPTATSSTTAAAPNTERQHHYGRDAAIGGGALGAGALAGSALSSDRHHDSTLRDSSSLPTTQHTTGTTNPSTVGTTSTSHQLPSATTGSSSQVPVEPQSQHHYGRDAGLAGAGAGIGAATTAGLSGSRDQPAGQRAVGSTAEDPASKTIGPHKSNVANILDPRVQPDPAKQKDHTTTGPHQSDTLNKADPKVDEKAGQHHYGRDAAVVGGTGAAGYGAYEAAKAYGNHHSTQPGASMQEQRYDTSAAGARAPNPVPATSEYNYHNPDVAALASTTGTGATGHQSTSAGQPYTTAQLAQSAGSQPPQAYKAPEIDSNDLGPKDNSSRNAALGAGAGLAGASAVGYGLAHHGDKDKTSTTQGIPQPGSSSLPQPTGSVNQGQQYSHSTEPSQSHTGRDAALVGGAGAAAGAGAGYAYGQRTQPQFDPKEQERLDKETAKRQHDLEKKHDKEAHKLEKEHEKDLKKHEKEAAKHEEKEEKKSGGLLGFLHRDKSKKEKSPSPESSPRQSGDRHYGRDAAVAGGAVAGGAALAEHERDDRLGHGSGYKGKNLLHKDPPANHPAAQALHANDRVGTDGPIGSTGTDASRTSEHHYGRDAAIGGGALGAGALGAHELSKDRTEPGTLSSSSAGAPGTHQSEHHYGRDAAIGGGALGTGALGAHELSKDRTEPGTLSSSTTGAPGTYQSAAPGQHSGLTGAQTTLPDRTRDEHHYGRDAAIGGGALGAGALGAHEFSKDRTEPSTLSSSTHHTADPSQRSALTGNQTTTSDRTRDDHHYGRDAAIGGTALGAGGLAAHKLHDNRTDPTSQQHTSTHQPDTFTGKREHIGIDGPIGDPNMISGDRQTRKGVYGAHPVSDLAQDHTVIEPRTGLPMNIGRYGDGAGGIDAGPVGHRQPVSVDGKVQPGGVDGAHAETDWEGVAKKNTIY